MQKSVGKIASRFRRRCISADEIPRMTIRWFPEILPRYFLLQAIRYRMTATTTGHRKTSMSSVANII